jgi:hypothetical protein
MDDDVFLGCSSLTIYCEATEKPAGWDDDWNGNCDNIFWGHAGYELLAPENFTANVSDDLIILNWTLPYQPNELALTGFLLKKIVTLKEMEPEEHSFGIINKTELINSGDTYYFTDDEYEGIGIPDGVYLYTIKAVYGDDLSDEVEFKVIVGDISDKDITIVKNTALIGNYPNPFNPSTTIKFSVGNNNKFHSNLEGWKQSGRGGLISLDIFNIKGQKIKTLFEGMLEAGEHSFVWNGEDDNGRSVGSGVYFYKLKTDSFTDIKKMILLK